MGTCSCFSHMNSSEPMELSPETCTNIEKTLSKKSVQYLQTPLPSLPLPEKYQKKLDSLPKFDFNESYPDLLDVTDNPKVFRSNFNDLFQSAWKNGQPNGPGKILYDKDECYYEGYIKLGEPYKKGRLLTKNLELYEGSFKNDRLSLEGCYTDTEGLKITGTFVNGLIQGKGEEKWDNGTYYSGQYVNGVKSGRGILIWENPNKAKEEKYEGEFADNLFEGVGTYLWGTTKQYTGNWSKGMMDGEGVFTWKDGRVFKGQFKEDKKNGTGVLEWTDGRSWKGNWKDDKQDGIGYMKNANGLVEIGLWEDGKRVKWLTKEEVTQLESGKK